MRNRNYKKSVVSLKRIISLTSRNYKTKRSFISQTRSSAIKFPGHVISKLSDVNWRARSCDLAFENFFLWSHLKDRVYADNPQTLEQIKVNITVEILPEKCRKVIENQLKKIEDYKRFHGGHLNNIVLYL